MPELPAQSLAEHHTVLVQDVVQAAHQAMLERDWDALRLMLHPYLHWTAADGSRLTWTNQDSGSVAECSAAGGARRCGAARWPDLPLAGAA